MCMQKVLTGEHTFLLACLNSPPMRVRLLTSSCLRLGLVCTNMDRASIAPQSVSERTPSTRLVRFPGVTRRKRCQPAAQDRAAGGTLPVKARPKTQTLC